jgi:chromate transporter
LMVKIDLFAFGGGFGSLPLMFQQVVSINNWLDSKTFMEGIALGQVTPCPIVITATFVGYLLYGLTGAIVATVSIFGPSFLILITVSPYFDRLKSSPYFVKATKGILASFAGLLFFMAMKFAFAIHWDGIRILFGLASAVALIKKADILFIVLIGGAISVFIF